MSYEYRLKDKLINVRDKNGNNIFDHLTDIFIKYTESDKKLKYDDF